MPRLFAAACAVSACLWVVWLLLDVLHYLEFPLQLDHALAEGLIGLTVLAILPALWVHTRDHERARAKQAGICRSCGYNLTGNVSRVCPECGTPVD